LKKLIKIILKVTISSFTRVLIKFRFGRLIADQIIAALGTAQKDVTHGGVDLSFVVPNSLNYFRADTFSSKEPETLEWIERIPKGSVFWDIGANVGLYSCYAAKARSCKVYAFEPSVFNLEILSRNINLNKLVGNIIIIPLPLTNELKVGTLNMTSIELGGALSTFGESYGDDGKNLSPIFEFSTLGISMDEVVRMLKIPLPSHIKMDVDGIEHLILSGGEFVLRQVSELSIEVNEDFIEQAANVKKYCQDAGLVFREKRNSEMLLKSARHGNTFNQVWYRP